MPAEISIPRRVPMDARLVRRLAWSTALLPVAWLALFGLYVLRARIALGVWPQPYQPDPQDLGFDLHHALIGLLLPLIVLGPVPALLWTLFSRAKLRALGVKPWLFCGVAIVLALLVFAYARLDPGHFVEWYFD